MKKKVLIILMILLSIFMCNIPTQSVYADGPQISVQDFGDENLYRYLQTLKASNNLPTNVILTRDSFINTKELDLSAYTTNYVFTSYKGLEKFTFTALETLNLSGNTVNNVDHLFSNMPNLKSLNLSYNKLEEIDISYLTNLNEVYLAGNNFKSYDDIVLHDREVSTDPLVETEYCDVWLNYNQLDVSQVPQTKTNLYILGVQGIKDGGLYYQSKEITFVPYDSVSGITIYNKNNEVVANLPYDNGGELTYSVSLSYGEYLIKISTTDSTDKFITDCDFEIQVPAPTYSFIQNGEEIEQPYKIYEPLTINFNAVEDGSLTIYVNDKKLTTNSFTIDEGGTYLIIYYQNVGENVSVAKSFVIISNMNVAVQWIYIIIGIVVFVVAIRLLLAYANRPEKGKLPTKEKF